MLQSLSATLPIFLIVGLGFVLTRVGLFSPSDMAPLSTFVVRIALPCLVFVSVSGRRVSDILQPTYLLTYALSAMVMFGLAFAWGALRRRTLVRSTFLAIMMGGTNNGFVGFAVFLILLPDVAGLAVGMDMLVDNLLIIPLTLFLAEQFSSGQASVIRRLRETVINTVTHPMVVAIVAALALTGLGWELPAPLARSVQMLAQASAAVSLFAVGGMLVGLRLGAMLDDIVVSIAGKLIVQPLVALGLLFGLPLLGLPALSPELAAAALLTASLPMYSIVPAMALKYHEHEVTAAAVLLSVVVSFVTMTGWIVVVQALGWLP